MSHLPHISTTQAPWHHHQHSISSLVLKSKMMSPASKWPSRSYNMCQGNSNKTKSYFTLLWSCYWKEAVLQLKAYLLQDLSNGKKCPQPIKGKRHMITPYLAGHCAVEGLWTHHDNFGVIFREAEDDYHSKVVEVKSVTRVGHCWSGYSHVSKGRYLNLERQFSWVTLAGCHICRCSHHFLLLVFLHPSSFGLLQGSLRLPFLLLFSFLSPDFSVCHLPIS